MTSGVTQSMTSFLGMSVISHDWGMSQNLHKIETKASNAMIDFVILCFLLQPSIGITPDLGNDWVDPDDGQCNNSDNGSISRLGSNWLILIISIVLTITKMKHY